MIFQSARPSSPFAFLLHILHNIQKFSIYSWLTNELFLSAVQQTNLTPCLMDTT